MIISEIVQDGGLLTLIIALTSLAELYVPSKKYLPLISVGFGVSISLIISGVSVETGIIGLVMGLSASGLYDQKYILGKKKEVVAQ